MDARLLDVLHDAGDEDVVAVATASTSTSMASREELVSRIRQHGVDLRAPVAREAVLEVCGTSARRVRSPPGVA